MKRSVIRARTSYTKVHGEDTELHGVKILTSCEESRWCGFNEVKRSVIRARTSYTKVHGEDTELHGVKILTSCVESRWCGFNEVKRSVIRARKSPGDIFKKAVLKDILNSNKIRIKSSIKRHIKLHLSGLLMYLSIIKTIQP